jgi:hypothetical protein
MNVLQKLIPVVQMRLAPITTEVLIASATKVSLAMEQRANLGLCAVLTGTKPLLQQSHLTDNVPAMHITLATASFAIISMIAYPNRVKMAVHAKTVLELTLALA